LVDPGNNTPEILKTIPGVFPPVGIQVSKS